MRNLSQGFIASPRTFPPTPCWRGSARRAVSPRKKHHDEPSEAGKHSPLGGSNPLLLFLALTIQLAWAEPVPVIEEIVVTGSWIRGTPEDAPLPVTRISRDDLRAQGSPGIIDLMRNLSFSQGADGESDQYGTRTGADRATVNLRGLGPSRSLVLLNSRRLTWSPGSIPDQAQLLVDVNLLPEAAFERIEILRDGAAATYGSDAIGGVVNFITRAGFEGFEVEARHKSIKGSDGDYRIGLIAGTAFAGGRGHLVSSLGHARRTDLPLVERDWAIRPYDENPRGGWTGTGRPGVFVPITAFSETAGNAVGMRSVSIADPNCELVGGKHTNAPTNRRDGGICRFQYTPMVNLVQDTRRWQWFSEVDWELARGLRLSAELLFAVTEVPRWATSPSYPPSQVIDLDRVVQANNPALVDMASKYAELYGDYAWCDADYCRWKGDGGEQDAAGVPAAWQNVAWVNGRLFGQEGPLRGHPRRSSTQRALLTLEGDWHRASWSATVSWARATRKEEDGDTLDYRDTRSIVGLGGYECEAQVANEYDARGTLRFSWQTLSEHAGRGPCRYWFPFSNAMLPHERVPGAGNPDYEPTLDNAHLINYLITARGFKGESSLLVFDTVLSTDSNWALRGGTVEYALGAQIRRETYDRSIYSREQGPHGGALQDLSLYPCRGGPAITDCQSGRVGVFTYLPPGHEMETDREVYSLFGEAALPVTSELDVQFSLRYEDYGSNGGSSLDPKFGLRWQATQGLALRLSAGTTFRAATLNQTQDGIAATSRQFVSRIGTFKPILALGNPDLDPEQATTLNAGLIFDRDVLFSSADHLFISLDYWSYAFTDPLVLEPYVRVLDIACPRDQSTCSTASPYFDKLDFGGEPQVSDIAAISVSLVNGPNIDTDGVDFKVEYFLPLRMGEWTLGLAGTRTLTWEIDEWPFGGAYNAAGRLNYDTPLARSLVDWKGQTFVNFHKDRFNLRWTMHYTGDYRHDFDSEPRISAHQTHDLVVSYATLKNSLTLEAALLNAADDKPPKVFRQLNYDPVTHNPLGRILQFGAVWGH